jgi:hypothetical protein
MKEANMNKFIFLILGIFTAGMVYAQTTVMTKEGEKSVKIIVTTNQEMIISLDELYRQQAMTQHEINLMTNRLANINIQIKDAEALGISK